MSDIKVGDTVRVVAEKPQRHHSSKRLTEDFTPPTGHIFTVTEIHGDGDLEDEFDRYVRPEDVEVIEDDNTVLRQSDGHPAPVVRVGQLVRATRTIEGEVSLIHYDGSVHLIDGSCYDHADGWSFEVVAEPAPALPTTPDSKIRSLDGGNDAVLLGSGWRYVSGEIADPQSWRDGFTVVRDAGAVQ